MNKTNKLIFGLTITIVCVMLIATAWIICRSYTATAEAVVDEQSSNYAVSCGLGASVVGGYTEKNIPKNDAKEFFGSIKDTITQAVEENDYFVWLLLALVILLLVAIGMFIWTLVRPIDKKNDAKDDAEKIEQNDANEEDTVKDEHNQEKDDDELKGGNE